MELFFNVILPIAFIGIAFAVGTLVEVEHYKNIKKREADLLHLPSITSKSTEDVDRVVQSELVYGSVVISQDHFKRFLAALRNIFGGRISSYESLLDRGRREAILRMKDTASAKGYHSIINMRFVTAGIGQVTAKKGSLGCFEVLAYGTAVK